MRVILSEKSREKLFSGAIDLGEIAVRLGVSRRSVSDWRRGVYSMPLDGFRTLIKLTSLAENSLEFSLVDDWQHTGLAGKKGAQIRFERHGPLGTEASRKLGGQMSYSARKANAHDIFTRKEIVRPAYDDSFAEFIGIMIGDGNVSKYQASVSLSSLVDVEYSKWVVSLFEQLFGLVPQVTKRSDANCLVIVASSIKLVEYLLQSGLPQGNKVKQHHDIPSWVKQDSNLEIACLRGIFDTDGCIFLENHGINGKLYSYPRMSFVSASSALRASIYDILISLDFSPKIRNNRSVNLEKRSDIARYFELIGSSNPKHLDRFNNFGGVG